MAFITKKHLSRRTFLKGAGVCHGVAFAGIHDSGGNAIGPDCGRRAHPIRRDLCAARRDDVQVDPGEGRHGLSSSPKSFSRSSHSKSM